MIKRPLAIVTGSASSTQTISTATYTSIQFDAEVRDEWAWHDNSTNNSRITVDRAGVYRVTGSVSFSLIGATCDITMKFLINGATNSDDQTSRRTSIGAAYGERLNLSGVLDLSAGDYVELQVRHNSGSNETVAKDQSQFAAEWVSY